MATIDLKDADGITQEVELPNANGRAAAAASRPVTLSTEDKAALDAAARLTVVSGTAFGTLGVPIMGSDGTNARALFTDSVGRLTIVGAGNGSSVSVTGQTASGVTDAGNPVKIGGVANSTAPTAVTAGQRVNAWYNLNGAAKVSFTDDAGSGSPAIGFPNSDGAATANSLTVVGFNRVFNGTNYDRQRDVTSASGTPGTGLLGTGILGYDGTNYQRIRVTTSGIIGTGSRTFGADGVSNNLGQTSSDGSNLTNYLMVWPYVFNGTTWDRARGDTEGAYVKQADVKTVTFTPATSAATLFSTATDGYAGISFQLSGAWVGTVTFESSNDNTNWTTASVMNVGTAGYTTAATGTGNFYVAAGSRYFRARVSAFTSGTVAGAAFLRGAATMSAAPGSSVTLGAGSNTIGFVLDAPSSNALAGVVDVSTPALASSLVLKASAGNLYNYNIVTTGTAGYLMFFDAATAPVDGAVTPKLCVQVAANVSILQDLSKSIRFTTGCVMVFSTTGPFTKTASATAFMAGGVA